MGRERVPGPTLVHPHAAGISGPFLMPAPPCPTLPPWSLSVRRGRSGGPATPSTSPPTVCPTFFWVTYLKCIFLLIFPAKTFFCLECFFDSVLCPSTVMLNFSEITNAAFCCLPACPALR